MSHFTVAVAVKDIKDLEKVMERFNENDEKYMTTFVEADETIEELRQDYNDPKEDYKKYTFDEFLSRVWGYIQKNGKVGYYTNEDAKWDWYMIGGRWSNMLKSIRRYDKCDFEVKKYIELDAPFREALEKKKVLFDSYIKHIKGKYTYKKLKDFETGKEYREQEIFTAIEQFIGKSGNIFDPYNPEYFCFGDFDLFKKKIYDDTVTTYAFIDIHGNWYEKGEMGWFGMSSNENPDWGTKWKEIYDSVPEDYTIVIVDCHI